MAQWHFPLDRFEGPVPEPPHLGAFGAVRKHHTHEGVDLYAPTGTPVKAVEPGVVVVVEPFTGPLADSPWWHDTQCVMIEGPSGVVNYGELTPGVTPGDKLRAGDVVGWIKQVLRKDKGRPMSMLHLELYEAGTRVSVEWKPGKKRPKTLLDPTGALLRAFRCK